MNIAPYAHLIVTVAIAIAVTGGIAFFAANRFGGDSRPQRQLVFFAVSAVCLLGLMGYVYVALLHV